MTFVLVAPLCIERNSKGVRVVKARATHVRRGRASLNLLLAHDVSKPQQTEGIDYQDDIVMGNSSTSSSSHSYVFPNWLWRQTVSSRMLILGLDNSGKTSILYRLKLGEVVSVIPTIGFNVEELQFSSGATAATIVSWDVGGRDRGRPLWRHYYQNIDSLVFVVDSTDRDRLGQAKDELGRLLREDELKGVPLLLFCNKQDQPNALTPAEITHHFFIADIVDTSASLQSPIMDRPFWAVGCSVINGTGLQEGLRWLATREARTPPQGTTTAAAAGNDVYQHGNAEEEKHRPMKSAVEQQRNDGPDPTVSSSTSRQASWLIDDMMGYSPSDSQTNPVLQSFRPIQRGSSCPFAKAAKLWGVKMVVTGEDNTGNNAAAAAAARNAAAGAAAALAEFVRRSDHGEPLDGFCIELGDNAAGAVNPSEFGVHVHAALRALSDLDPSGERAMRVQYIGARGWRFRFARADFFVTTFSPCYPSTNSRYAFGTGAAFILLQPELSFYRHNLPDDTPVTHDPPNSIRDKTRMAFRDAGCGYFVPATTSYPPAEHIVKPLYDDGLTGIRWWDQKGSSSMLDYNETKEAS
jgi:ADP-ribosylation factor 1/2